VENEETLKPSALVGQFPDPVQNQVDDFLSNSVVATSVVVGSILLAGDQLFGVEQLPVSASPHFINNSGFQVNENSPRDVFSSAGFAEESIEAVITTSNGFVRGHLAIRLNPVLKAIEFPAGIADLDSSLANMDGDTFTHLIYLA